MYTVVLSRGIIERGVIADQKASRHCERVVDLLVESVRVLL
jgi:hypothetical protein